jgi:hypothetical protein
MVAQARLMPNKDKTTGPSELDPQPGQARSQNERNSRTLREQAHKNDDPVPPIACEYNGWER